MGVLSGTLRPMAFKNVKKPLFSAVFRRFLWDGCVLFSYSQFEKSFSRHIPRAEVALPLSGAEGEAQMTVRRRRIGDQRCPSDRRRQAGCRFQRIVVKI